MATPDELIKIVQNKIIPELDSMVQDDLYFNKIYESIESDSQKILTEFKWIRDVLKENIPWELKNLSARLYKMRNIYPSEFVIQYIDSVDIGEGFKFTPILISYATISPKTVPRDLRCSYKGHWIAPDITDDLLNRIIRDLNHEHPSLDSSLEEFFLGHDGKDTYTYEYEDVERKSRKEKIHIRRTLHEPLVLTNVQVSSPEDKNSVLNFTVITLSQFLKPESKKFRGARSPALAMRLLEDLMNSLEKFMVEDDEEIDEETLGVVEIEDEDESSLEVNRCPNCGWILSKGREKCPMCGADLTLMDTEENTFSASAALENVEETRITEKLLDNIENFVESFDTGMEEDAERIDKAIMEEIQKDPAKDQLVGSLEPVNEEEREKYRYLIKTLEIELNKLDIVPMKIYKIKPIDLSFDEILMVESILKEEYTDYHPGIISYITTVPKFPGQVQLEMRINPYSEKLEATWVKEGDDLGIASKLNNPKFQVYTLDVFGGEEQRYASHFQAKKIDLIGRLQDVEGMEYELPFMVKIGRFHPRLMGAPEDKGFIILNQFLKSKAENYSGFIPFSKVFVLLDAIIAGVKGAINRFMGLTSGAMSEEIEEEAEDVMADNIIDESILGDEIEEESSKFEEEEPVINLDEIDAMIDEVNEPDEEELPESLIEEVKGPSLREVKDMQRQQLEEELRKAKEIDISKMETPAQEISLDIDEIFEETGDQEETVSTQPERPQLPDDLVQQCLKYEIDPEMSLEQLEQKAKELQFQRENLNDLIAQTRAAMAEGRITQEQLNQQMEMIKNEAMKLNEQIMLVEQLIHLKR